MTSEYEVSEDDVKGGGSRTAKPIGNYEGVIEESESAKDSNGRPYLKFRIGNIFSGPQKAGLLFEKYLPFGKKGVKSGKNAGKEMLDPRTASFLRATGQRSGIPVGAPGGRPASDLNGTIVKVRVEHQYGGKQADGSTILPAGKEYPVRSWEKTFKADLASGILDDIEPQESLGFYEISDDFEGIGASDGGEEQWG